MSAPCPILAFVVELELRDHDGAAAERVKRSLIEDLLEPRGLVGGAGHRGRRWLFLVQSEAGQVTELDREALLAWTRHRDEIATVEIGPIIDRCGNQFLDGVPSEAGALYS
jgi:uncharacterized protein YggL (DUF469 family)